MRNCARFDPRVMSTRSYPWLVTYATKYSPARTHGRDRPDELSCQRPAGSEGAGNAGGTTRTVRFEGLVRGDSEQLRAGDDKIIRDLSVGEGRKWGPRGKNQIGDKVACGFRGIGGPGSGTR